MAGAVTRFALTNRQVSDRFSRPATHLDHWGDVTARDYGEATSHRLIESFLVGPGDDLPVEITALYREYYDLNHRGEWAMAKYTYEYLDRRYGRRLAYHLHPIGGRRLIPHAHCEPASSHAEEESREHFRALEYNLREAHAEFMELWASDRPPDCSGLLPLAVRRQP